MQAIVKLQNIAHCASKRRLGRPLSRAIEITIRAIFHCSLPAEARIHRTVRFHHGGLAVIVNKASVIGERCEISPHAVLGGKAPLSGAPRLEANVIVHTGAKLIGPIVIGKGAIIGANAVVLSDVPAGATVVGIPAKAIKIRHVN